MQLLLPLLLLIVPTFGEPDASACLSSTMPRRVWTYDTSRSYLRDLDVSLNDIEPGEGGRPFNCVEFREWSDRPNGLPSQPSRTYSEHWGNSDPWGAFLGGWSWSCRRTR